MRILTAITMSLAMFGMAGGPVHATSTEISVEQAVVLQCLEGLGTDTQWDQCVNQLFQPCQGLEVGSDDQLACLTREHGRWTHTFDGERERLISELTSTGASELTLLLGQWFGYIAQKCATVASEKSGPGAEAAQLGCEISEMAGVTAEFSACRQGSSTAPYCVIQE